MDVALWELGKTTIPKSAACTGGKFANDDDQETPNTQLASFDFGDTQLVFEVRGLLTMDEGGLKRRGGHTIGDISYGSDGVLAMEEKSARGESETGRHMTNFLNAVKSRKHQDLACDVETGALSASLCHLANISYRLGRKLNFDAASGKFTDAEANKMITRNYRAPYVVPEKVQVFLKGLPRRGDIPGEEAFHELEQSSIAAVHFWCNGPHHIRCGPFLSIGLQPAKRSSSRRGGRL
ncbi:MAG: hypothetical protein JJE04_15580 [Acidobacteriia bacterium]|nr:hypothetical protein [Terriglobia bacterium]